MGELAEKHTGCVAKHRGGRRLAQGPSSRLVSLENRTSKRSMQRRKVEWQQRGFTWRHFPFIALSWHLL